MVQNERPYQSVAEQFESALQAAEAKGYARGREEGRLEGVGEGYRIAWDQLAQLAAKKAGASITMAMDHLVADLDDPEPAAPTPAKRIARGTVDTAVREIIAEFSAMGIVTGGIITRAKARDERILAASVRNTLRRMRDYNEIHKIGRNWFPGPAPEGTEFLKLAAE